MFYVDKCMTTKEGWFTQTLDHFDPSNKNTFRQRFYYNDKYFKPGGPIFVQIGGEGEIFPSLTHGDTLSPWQWVVNGKKHNATMYYLEHRFFGATQPTGDLNVKSLKFLTSKQALADLAGFIASLKQNRTLSNAKVLVFGGSYPGNLAAWFRLRYPNVTDGAVASSAPVWTKADFFEYLEVVGNVSETVSPGCDQAIKTAFRELYVLVGSNKMNELRTKFNLCSTPSNTDQTELAFLYQQLYNIFQGKVQYNGQSGQSGILLCCEAMLLGKIGSPLDRLANIVNPIGIETGCLNVSYSSLVSSLRIERPSPSEAMRQWIWLTCTEFGYFQTGDSDKQPFGRHLPLSFWLNECKAVFDGVSNATIAAGIHGDVDIYGGRTLRASNVVLVNGGFDPWHRLGVLKTQYPTSPAIFIPGASHCQDMKPAETTDSLAILEGRQRIADEISRMLSTPTPAMPGAAAPSGQSAALVFAALALSLTAIL